MRLIWYIFQIHIDLFHYLAFGFAVEIIGLHTTIWNLCIGDLAIEVDNEGFRVINAFVHVKINH